MSIQLHVEALLHLSALVLIVSIAYLGLDKIHLEKDQFLEALNASKELAINFVRRCDVKPGETPEKVAMFYRFPPFVKLKFYAICAIADTNGSIKMGMVYRPLHYCHRVKYVPLHGYFSDRRDRFWVLLIALFSLVAFFYLTATALWDLDWFPGDLDGWLPNAPAIFHMHWISNKTLFTPIYWCYCIGALWIIFSVAVTYRLRNIQATTGRLINAVDTHMTAAADDNTRYALQKAQAVSQKAAPPPG